MLLDSSRFNGYVQQSLRFREIRAQSESHHVPMWHPCFWAFRREIESSGNKAFKFFCSPRALFCLQTEALFGDLEKVCTILAGACLTSFAGLVSVSKPKLWAPFLGLGLFFSLAAAASILRKWCWKGAQFDSGSTTGSVADVYRGLDGPANV